MKSATARSGAIQSVFKLLLLCAAIPIQATTPAPKDTDSLATPQYKGEHTVPLTKGDPYPGHYTLIVSWIPGDGNAGYLRYMVIAAPEDPYESRPKDPNTYDWEPREALKRIQSCPSTLRVYAPGNRLLASIPLFFKGDVNWTNEYDTISDNSLTQMSLATYREFLKAPAPASWNIIPACK
jgi:hypothetical protein